MDEESALKCLKMLKDMKLYNSVLSQTQIKSEIQQMVTQTVQIGPVQNQGANSQGASTFSNYTNST